MTVLRQTPSSSSRRHDLDDIDESEGNPAQGLVSRAREGGSAAATEPEPRRLLSNSQVPLWYTDSFILTGYRPVTHSVKFCFNSLTYLHNETVNIYSHLIPAFCAVILASLMSSYFRATFPKATRSDRLAFEVYLATSTVCFAVSSLYHTLLCHSRYYRDLWVRLDYVAIVFQILGSFVSGIYIGFYCEPQLQKLYWSIVSSHRRTPTTVYPTHCRVQPQLHHRSGPSRHSASSSSSIRACSRPGSASSGPAASLPQGSRPLPPLFTQRLYFPIASLMNRPGCDIIISRESSCSSELRSTS